MHGKIGPYLDQRSAWTRWLHLPVYLLYSNAFWLISSLGLPPAFIVRLEVKGRRSGRVRSTVLLRAEEDGERYLVSVLGEESEWARNVRAADGDAVIRHGRRQRVRLEEVPVNQRAPILKAYLKRALGARPLFEVRWKAPIEEFERIAPKYPVFRIVSATE